MDVRPPKYWAHSSLWSSAGVVATEPSIFGIHNRVQRKLEGLDLLTVFLYFTLLNSREYTGNRGLLGKSKKDISLPQSLRTLTLGHQFNQSLEAVNFPCGLQSLTFGDQFNQSLEDVRFPDGLQTLSFGSNFNQSLDGISKIIQGVMELDGTCCFLTFFDPPLKECAHVFELFGYMLEDALSDRVCVSQSCRVTQIRNVNMNMSYYLYIYVFV